MTVQKLRQGYNNVLVPSEDSEALLREQLEIKDKVIADKDRFINTMLTLIPKYHSGDRSKCQPINPPQGR